MLRVVLEQNADALDPFEERAGVDVRGAGGAVQVAGVGEAACTSRSPATLAQVRLRLAVLPDPARLSLCRHLVNEPITTSDPAVRTGTPLPQASRHFGRLRQVGLLTRRDGRQTHHRLDTVRLMHLGVDVPASVIR
ncbi:helix-turn-helix domain-containing protein [Streptomyces sp. NPDC088921]|uniref:ArsR/SmtB family transcription factor n=1 Tax=unclassified Streptomyces TaxID=2593676 RepID=UPI0034334E8A